jgi:hypothetical protein
MTDMEKLKHLLKHWIEHNNAHVRTYTEWAEKMDKPGKEDLFNILKNIVDESEKLGKLFEKALNII